MKLLVGAALLLVALATLGPSCEAGSAPAWLLEQRNPRQLERESEATTLHERQLLSPVQIGAARYASQLFNGRVQSDLEAQFQANERDMFQCVDPTRQLFNQFINSYGRQFYDNAEQIERLGIFTTTLKRIIMLNRLVQNDILNRTNYELAKKAMGNYHFITPLGAQNVALWYSDINDCELGLIKYHIFNVFYQIESNNLARAYKTVVDNNEYLPMMSADGFEQLANILLVRLYDRFAGDFMMDQLFQWPTYMKKLATFAYNRRQAAQPDFESRLRVISFAYPTYYKDVKYNLPAFNRTNDNLDMHKEHELFNSLQRRKFADLREKNKRLTIFRQRRTLADQLNNPDRWSWTNISVAPEWQRLQSSEQALANGGLSGQTGDRLRDAENADAPWLLALKPADQRVKQTQFSDLTDLEFVAYLNNDHSLLDQSSSRYLESNFPVRRLDEQFKSEIASELELRRMIAKPQDDSHITCKNRHQQPNAAPPTGGASLERRVVEELVADVGLPIGPTSVTDIPEEEYHSLFVKIGRAFGKSYHGAQTPEQADERQRRYEQFKINYGRFKAWQIKEGWENELDESRLIAMLRLADLSWHELKVLLFRVCCLTEANLASLSADNSTIHYMGTHQYLCQPLSANLDELNDFDSLAQQVDSRQRTTATAGAPNQQRGDTTRELAGLELYYYYSVHFNKHHSDMDSFYRRLAVFKSNIDQIRRHSCVRGLSLFHSLRFKQADTLSNIDVLDARRAHMEDINLDRFRYFTIPSLSDGEQAPTEDEMSASNDIDQAQKLRQLQRQRGDNQVSKPGGGDGGNLSRAGISYRRDSFFSSLLDQNQSPEWTRTGHPSTASSSSIGSYPSLLVASAQDSNKQVRKYKKNSAFKIYDIVTQRYKLCMSVINQRVPNLSRPLQCQPAGPLAEQSQVWLTESLSLKDSVRVQQTEQCSFYRLGLSAWSEGLIKQDALSARLIQSAKCQ